MRLGAIALASLAACGAPSPSATAHDPVAAAGATADALRAIAVGEVRAELERPDFGANLVY